VLYCLTWSNGKASVIIADKADPNTLHCSDFKAVVWSAHCRYMQIVERFAGSGRGWNYMA